jgi:tetratricopeptide (TPR) repeat protein
MTSATAGANAAAPDIYLPVADEMLARPFNRAEVGRAATLQTFRERVAPSSRQAFDKGVDYLAAGNYASAETSFKSAISPDTESTAILAYLAACFAAAGHDEQAASAWQTALVDGSDLPQIYEWLGDALLRTRDLAQARAILEEALEKWPSDSRFAKSLAMLYAMFGQGREAVRTLERYLSDHQTDMDALRLGVEWIYQLHLAGAVAHAPAEDVKIARGYADAYLKAKGPQPALVRQWMEYLGRKK